MNVQNFRHIDEPRNNVPSLADLLRTALDVNTKDEKVPEHGNNNEEFNGRQS